MQEPEPLISLGLNAPPAKPGPSSTDILPPAESLQFRRAEHAPDPANGPQCSLCKKSTGLQYFQVNGANICQPCASAVEAGQKSPRAHLLLKGFLFGLGAAVAGSILYSVVTIVTGYQLALISILIGYMVAKSIRHAAGGGRPQQIMAVLLTYLSITTSYIPVAIYNFSQHHPTKAVAGSAPGSIGSPNVSAQPARPPVSPLRMIIVVLGLVIAAPFTALKSTGGFLSLLIISFGLRRAWQLTARPDLIISGPFEAQAPA